MGYFFEHIVFWPFLIGLVPIVLARTWRGRRMAILLGAICVGFWFHGLCVNAESPAPNPLRGLVIPVFGALSTALISVIVTYRLDRKHETKT